MKTAMTIALVLILHCVPLVGQIFGLPGGRVTTTVRVVSDDGEPLAGMKVGLTYSRVMEKDSQGIFEGRTDARGEVAFTGRAQADTHVELNEMGYYPAYRKVRSYELEKDSKKRIFRDKTIELVAKKRVNPIVMISDGFFRLLVPEFGKELGYDFFRNDWVAPHGEGEHSDVFLKVDGYFNSERDRKSTLVARFPNPGDGMVAFEADLDQGSALKSDHSAPGEGYESEWHWNTSVREDPKMNRGILERDYHEDRGYYLRLRTEYDEAGNVVSCHYGKIYGDFSFDGVWPRDSGIVCEAYYVNPNPNDRNVEARTGETLIPDPDLIDRPRLP